MQLLPRTCNPAQLQFTVLHDVHIVWPPGRLRTVAIREEDDADRSCRKLFDKQLAVFDFQALKVKEYRLTGRWFTELAPIS